jgi:hypothetical protein
VVGRACGSAGCELDTSYMGIESRTSSKSRSAPPYCGLPTQVPSVERLRSNFISHVLKYDHACSMKIAYHMTSLRPLRSCIRVCCWQHPKVLSRWQLLCHIHFGVGAASALVLCNLLHVLYVLLMNPSNVSSKPLLLPRPPKQESPKPPAKRQQVLVACSICRQKKSKVYHA